MKLKRKILLTLFVVVSATYPIWVFFGLRWVTPTIIVVILLAFLLVRHYFFGRDAGILIGPILLFSGAGVFFLFWIDSMAAVRSYPVLVNVGMAALFADSLSRPPSAIERLARLVEPKLDQFGVVYTRYVTWIWLVFFLCNASVAAWTAIYGSLDQWTVYNGLISYILMGSLFVVEYIVRIIVRRRVRA